jgi:AcrR family transcriptional regulator
MGRKLKEHAVRRQELIDAALQLFCDKGYDKTSVNDILHKVGVAKGTFYHYFKSKEELLDQLVQRLTDHAMSEINKVVENKKLNAIEKLNQVMSVSRRVKAEHTDIIKAIISVNLKEENLVIQHKLRERNRQLVVPLYQSIIRQGIAEGVFDIPYPDEAAVLLANMTQATADRNTSLILTSKQYPNNLETIHHTMKLLEIMTERILGMPKGSFKLHDENFINDFLHNLKQ